MCFLSNLGSWITEHATVISAVVSAIAAAVIAWFTVSLARATTGMLTATSEQSRLTKESIELANKEFIASHRPRLRVRRIKAHLQDDDPLRISYVVVNVGETRAAMERHEVWLHVVPSGTDERPLQEKILVETLQLERGEFHPFITTEKTDIKYNTLWGIHPEGRGGTFQVRGIIEYNDDNGVMRRTAFLRTYDPKLGRFRPSDDPEEEYED